MNETQPRTPFNVHIGVGQTYNEQEEVTGFIQNYFSVTVPVTFTIDVNDTRSLSLIMNVKYITLANIILEREAVPEFLQGRMTPEVLADGGVHVEEGESPRASVGAGEVFGDALRQPLG